MSDKLAESGGVRVDQRAFRGRPPEEFSLLAVAGNQKALKDFLQLPAKLSGKGSRSLSLADEKALLIGEHPLSGLFHLQGAVIYQGKSCLGRIALTIYPNNSTAYLGFFACYPVEAAAQKLFSWAEEQALAAGCNKIQGPIDASFWISYRQKLDAFTESVYFGEPGGLAYYPEFYELNGYELTQTYLTNIIRGRKTAKNEPTKSEQRRRAFEQKGYEFIPLKQLDFDLAIEAVYDLLMELYRDFPVFSPLDKKRFIHHYRHLKQIVSKDLSQLVYFNGEAVGFFVCLPDYKGALQRSTVAALFKLLQVRIYTRKYVVLYVGAQKAHQGLASAMLAELEQRTHGKKGQVVAALIQKQVSTRGLGKDYIQSSRHYGLWEKSLARKKN